MVTIGVKGRDMAATVKMLVKGGATLTVNNPDRREVTGPDGAVCYTALRGRRGWLVRCISTGYVKWTRPESESV